MSSESFAQELIQVERKGWEALCSAEAVTYYRQHLTEDALMAFRFGVMDRDEVLSAMAAAGPWASFDMETPRVIQLGNPPGDTARSRLRCSRVRGVSAARRPGDVLGGPE
jgi:hypothetical protein